MRIIFGTPMMDKLRGMLATAVRERPFQPVDHIELTRAEATELCRELRIPFPSASEFTTIFGHQLKVVG